MHIADCNHALDAQCSGSYTNCVRSIARTLLVAATALSAATAEAAPRELGPVGVETDPVSSALGARTLTIQVDPPRLSGVALSAVAFSGEFPAFAQQALRLRNDDGVRWRIRPSFGGGIDYFWNRPGSGWFVGLVALQFHNRIARGNDRSDFHTLNLIPRIGYRWFFTNNINVYVAPFVGPRFEFRVAGDPAVGGAEFDIPTVTPFATMHLGIHL